jgi:hypothetical protein
MPQSLIGMVHFFVASFNPHCAKKILNSPDTSQNINFLRSSYPNFAKNKAMFKAGQTHLKS